MIRLLVFLGNPGKQYSRTRHNIGWMLLDHLERQSSLNWQKKFKGAYAKSMVNGRDYYLLKPDTFMNKSGESVWRMADFFNIETDDILTVHDDLELSFGKTAVKKGGGLGGHNGLRSIKESLGSDGFHRLRMGIGRPERGSVSSHVLGRFTREEEAELDDFIRNGYTVLQNYLEN